MCLLDCSASTQDISLNSFVCDIYKSLQTWRISMSCALCVCVCNKFGLIAAYDQSIDKPFSLKAKVASPSLTHGYDSLSRTDGVDFPTFLSLSFWDWYVTWYKIIHLQARSSDSSYSVTHEMAAGNLDPGTPRQIDERPLRLSDLPSWMGKKTFFDRKKKCVSSSCLFHVWCCSTSQNFWEYGTDETSETVFFFFYV